MEYTHTQMPYRPVVRSLARYKGFPYLPWTHPFRILALLLFLASLVNPVLTARSLEMASASANNGSGDHLYRGAGQGAAQANTGEMIYLPSILNLETGSWPTLAANPQRTSWSPEEV